jgi:hypothetical protein
VHAFAREHPDHDGRSFNRRQSFIQKGSLLQQGDADASKGRVIFDRARRLFGDLARRRIAPRAVGQQDGSRRVRRKVLFARDGGGVVQNQIGELGIAAEWRQHVDVAAFVIGLAQYVLGSLLAKRGLTFGRKT